MELISWPDGLTAEGIKLPAYISRLHMWLTVWSHYWVPDTAERSPFIISPNPSNNPEEVSVIFMPDLQMRKLKPREPGPPNL